ncbi:glycoside hydrolase family protein [Herbaspirillum sp. RTI4]
MLPIALALAQFAKWVRGGGRVLPGLVKRRALEAARFDVKD